MCCAARKGSRSLCFQSINHPPGPPMHRFMFTLGLLAAWPVAALIQAPPVDAMTSLPVAELKAIEADGEVFFMSANGRFVFRGQLTDAWHRQPLDSLAAIRHASTHIDLDAMGVPLDALNTLTVGEGPRRVVVFVDPRCGYCKRFMAAAQPQAQRYTFKFVVVPALGDDSQRLARALFCASDKADAVALFQRNQLDRLPQPASCDARYYDLTLTVAQLSGVQAVPFFIAPDGRYRAGGGESIWQWLEGEQEP